MKKLFITLLTVGVLFASQQYVDAVGTSVSVSLTSGSATISEKPTLSDSGYPTSEYAALQFDISPGAPNDSDSTFIVTTSSQCFLSLDGKGGGIYGQRMEEQSSSYGVSMSTVRVTVAGVDDSKYEGKHSCKVTGVLESPDPSINGATASKTISLTDNDEPPLGTTTKPDLSDPVEPKPTPTQTTADTEETPRQKLPAPLAKLVDSNGQELKPKDGEDKVVFEDKEPIVLSGNTIANGVVKLYIFSEPQQAEVTSDANGDWSYTIESIEPGDHRVEVEVVNPETGEASEREQVLAFAVAETEPETGASGYLKTPLETVDETESDLNYLLIGIGAVGGVSLIALLVVSRMHPIQYLKHLVKH